MGDRRLRHGGADIGPVAGSGDRAGFDGATVTARVAFGPSVTVFAGCVNPEDVADVIHIQLRIHDTTPGFRDGIQRCPAGMYRFGKVVAVARCTL